MTIHECKEKLNEILNIQCENALYDEAKNSLLELKPVQLANALCGTYRKFTEDEKDIITLFIKVIQAIYNNSSNEEILTDELYDKLYQVYVDQTGDEIVGAPIYGIDSKNKVTHKYAKLRGTIQKVHFISNNDKPENENRKSLEDYENSWRRQLGNSIFNSIKYIFTIKWDGLSSNLEFDKYGNLLRVLPRGNVRDNETEDKYYKFKDLHINGYDLIGVPQNSLGCKEGFCVKCELVCSEEHLKILNEKYGMEFKNRRSAVAGLLGSDDTPIALMQYITIMPLRYQVDQGDEEHVNYNRYKIIYHDTNTCNDKERFELYKTSIDTLKETAELSGYPADGVVISIINDNIKRSLGRDDDKGINKYEVAYKFPPEIGTSRIIDVEFTTGTMGIITPVAKIKPIKLKGATIKSINLGSMDRFEELDIGYCDECRIKYDVIPYLYFDNDCYKSDDKIPSPHFCQYCGCELEKKPTLMCVNENCDCRVIGKILNYVNKMNILEISSATITDLYNIKVLRRISDLYSLEQNADVIIQLEGWGRRKLDKIIEQIESKKDVYDYELLGSVGIQSIGRQMFKRIISKIDIDDLIDLCSGDKNIAIERLIKKVPGVKTKTAIKIYDGINKNLRSIQELRDILNVKYSKDSNTTGKVCFTNIRNKEIEDALKDKGYEITNSVTKDTTILVTPNNFNGPSSKLDKAKKYNVRILPIGSYELYKLIK